MENLLPYAVFATAVIIVLIIWLVMEIRNNQKNNRELDYYMLKCGQYEEQLIAKKEQSENGIKLWQDALDHLKKYGNTWHEEADRRQSIIEVMEQDYKKLMLDKNSITSSHADLVKACADHKLSLIASEKDFETLVVFIQAQSDENKWLRDKMRNMYDAMTREFSKDAIDKMFLN